MTGSCWSTGSADIRAQNTFAHFPRKEDNHIVRLSDAATIQVGNWNCGGLSKVKKDMVSDLDLDILCLTETHNWRDDDPLTIYSEPSLKNDTWSGVALKLSKRVSGYVICSGVLNSRIVYCRLRGLSGNLFVIGIYIPQRKRANPDQNETYAQLELLLSQIRKRDCVILLGDFNRRLSRNVDGFVGRWCIHNRRDSGGDQLFQIMKMFSLRCVSTCYFYECTER